MGKDIRKRLSARPLVYSESVYGEGAILEAYNDSFFIVARVVSVCGHGDWQSSCICITRQFGRRQQFPVILRIPRSEA